MGSGYRRADLQALAQAKLDDAVTLFQNGRYSNAYYLAGYAVEIGLKACIAATIAAETIPDKALIKGILNHQFIPLVSLAGLAKPLKDEQDRNPNFEANWIIVMDWEPDSRYETSNILSARLLIDAISDPKSGVLQWIKTYW